MILADKIIQLRKKAGWSQEDLAEMLGVSRQSVSKWEGAQSTPELDRIIQMSQIFGVSTDFLLKDEMEIVEHSESRDHDSPVRRLSMEEASDFLQLKEETSRPLSLGVGLMIVCPIPLLLLVGALERGSIDMSEGMATTIGMAALLIAVVAGLALTIFSSSPLKKYEFIEEEFIETEYGVTGMVRDRKDRYQATYVRGLVVGIGLLVLSALPVLSLMVFEEGAGINTGLPVGLTLIMVALGVMILMRVTIPNVACEQILQEGDYTRQAKRAGKILGPIMGIYWTLATTIYLGYSFYTGNWAMSWIIWPVAGVFSAIVAIVVKFFATTRD